GVAAAEGLSGGAGLDTIRRALARPVPPERPTRALGDRLRARRPPLHRVPVLGPGTRRIPRLQRLTLPLDGPAHRFVGVERGAVEPLVAPEEALPVRAAPRR